MKFINKTGKTKKVRINSESNTSGYDWLTIKEGDQVEISESYGKALSFTPADQKADPKKDKKAKEQAKPNKSDAPKAQVTKESRDQFYKDLIKIDGIGPKTANDILKIYLKKEDLIKDLRSGKDVPIRDDLADAIKSEW